MLVNGSRLINTPLMSLQTGGEVARSKQAIIDPARLEIIAYAVEGPLLGTTRHYILIGDIRELSDMGFIIDSIDEFVLEGDVVRLDAIMDYHFDVLGRSVVNESGRKLGHVVDYTIDVDSFYIQQLIVRRPLLRSLNDTELVIHRTQITEINDKAIVINEQADIPEHTRVTTPGSYINPFRSSSPQPDTTTTKTTV